MMSCKSPIGEEFTNFAFLETLQGAKAYFQESVWCVCASVCLCAWSGGGLTRITQPKHSPREMGSYRFGGSFAKQLGRGDFAGVEISEGIYLTLAKFCGFILFYFLFIPSLGRNAGGPSKERPSKFRRGREVKI